MAERNPVAFMTYLRRVDQHDRGRLTELRERLEGEVQLHTGDEDFAIFQDRKDILWGQQWESRIEGSLDDVTFLIPIITPGFFNSKPCREEIVLFLERERKLGRSDLILPIYYIDYPDFNDEERHKHDPLMAEIAKHQHADWRDLRHESMTSAAVGRTLSELAVTLRDAMSERRSAERSEGGVALAAPKWKTRPSPDQMEPLGDTAVQFQEEGSPAATSSATAKPEPPMLVVNPLHRGDHTTISAAIEAAKPGTIIKVEPGLYQEGFVVDKPLEIIGEGAAEDVVIEVADKEVILFQATMGRIANVTLRQLGGQFFGVNIARGRLDLEDCDITSEGGACVAIHSGADPRLRRNRIHDGKQSGVYVYDQGRGTLEDNDIFANTYPGVGIQTGGDPVLRRNRIRDGEQNGVHVYDQGRGTLEDNEIFANTYPGVAIRTGGDPVLRRNLIHHGKHGGVYIHNQGRGTLEDNDFFANNDLGVAIRSGGDPVLRRNRIHDGKRGVLICEQGRGTLEDNDIFANSHAGVEIREGSDPVLRRNRIHDGKRGVLICEQGRGTLEDNDIFANAEAGVKIIDGSHPVLRRNQISKNGYEAIWVHKSGGGTFEENDLRGNERGPWDIAKESESKVIRRDNQE